ncbi:MAG TPA: type I DNA topoisomerase [Stellaceae bacterium]|nr:type I DNA topoisomerase [Stellaceae bacterium]
MNIVVVESPAKAKTINKYLGPDYRVLASYGHVRDLPAKDGSVRPDEDFSMSWEVDAKGEKRLKEILAAVRGADQLFLATDPDREGEAISWHVQEVLRQRRALRDVDVKRVVFNEVTKNAVLDAFRHPRELNRELVEAYLARRALDYLVGFTLSPVLWRKLPGSRSAGRVQSVALRLICEREAEIEAFKPREYWSIEAEFRTPAGHSFTARLTHLGGQRLDKFALATEAEARRAAETIARTAGFAVAEIEKKQVKRHPQPPFTTSTLQQEASRKLGFGASRTMSLAQRLYEGVDIGGETVGLITYMRTDGVSLSDEAIAAVRHLVEGDYGREYRPAQPRMYKSAAKNAQEAHEAIRPTEFARRPDTLARALEPDQHRLYELIWKRAVASQMESARLDQVAVDITSTDRQIVFRATGSVVAFDGFLKLYHEDRDDPEEDDENRRLPAMQRGEALQRGAVKPEQHFTQPPPRYSEASLVKKLEELGIGRPSTYASIIQVLQDRSYVRLEKKRFIPEDRGRLVTAFLTSFFERLVQYNFTAELENQLDDISGGRSDWKAVLRDFWRQFSAAIDGTKDLTISQVIAALDEELGPHFFPGDGSGRDPRLCPGCNAGRLSLKLGKFGAFIGCSNYPECRYTRPLAVEGAGNGENGESADAGPRQLGIDPASDQPVSVRKGPYGHYVQLGEGENGEKPKRVSLPRGMRPGEIDLETALRLLALPREIGRHPESGEPIVAGIGRFGPYVKHGSTFKSLAVDDDVLTIGLNRAVSLLAEPGKGRRAAPTPLRELGPHPADAQPVALFRGRYGPYVSHDGLIASLPKALAPEHVTLEEAVALLAAQEAKGKKRRSKKAAAKAARPRAAARTEEPADDARAGKISRRGKSAKAGAPPASKRAGGKRAAKGASKPAAPS